MAKKVAVLVNRAALNRQIIVLERDRGGLRSGRAIDDARDFFDRAVHVLDLAIGPRMVGRGEPVLDTTSVRHLTQDSQWTQGI